jgi:sulfate adenylyltransferase subunit 2
MEGSMDHLDQLENRSVHILREAYANFKNLGMLWSIGKDSTVLLWLAQMIEYRDRLRWNGI